MKINRRNRICLFARRIVIGMSLAVLLGVSVYVFADLFYPLPLERMHQASRGGAAQILDCEGGLIAWRVDKDDCWRVPVGYAQVSPWLVRATVAAEDKRFWQHTGVDPVSVCRALGQNVRYGKRISGASTLSMQTMRLLTPRPRTWRTKLVETFRALQTESVFTKEDILEVYFNLAPYGGNVIGVEAAARRFFGKPAASLTLGEAALLAGLPQSPARFNPVTHLDRAMRRRAYVLQRMGTLGLASAEEIDCAMREPIRLVKSPVRTHAPRFADELLLRTKCEGGVLHSTISPRIQSITRMTVEEQLRDVRLSGVDGLAAVVIDVERAELVAMVGNAMPDDPQHGWVNAATSPRQPGSLLKPFLYGLAYQRGLLTPQAVVYDVPGDWGGYRPRNMDREYLGALSASRALSLSRNVPAVRLVDRLGPDTLLDCMQRLGMSVSGTPETYGLSIALGTAELHLLDITNAYAALARMGQYAPLRVLRKNAAVETAPVFSAGAAWLVLRSLGAAESGAPLQPVWKTGTSWNHRDAWAVALSPQYAVGIWCGQMAGRGNARLVGADAALPVALSVLARITPGTATSWSRPPSAKTRQVCALSGAPAGMHCPHQVEAEYLRGVSSGHPCPLHQKDSGSGRIICRWPAPVRAFLEAEKTAKTAPASAKKSGFSVLTPVEGATYVLPTSTHVTSQTMEFRAVASSGARIDWFVDGVCLGNTQGNADFSWKMTPGMHHLIAAHENGTQKQIRFQVQPLVQQ